MSDFLGTQDIRYGFAVGRIRVLEGRLLGAATYERLLAAPDLEEQKRILLDTHVGRWIADARTAADVEAGLDASLVQVYEEFLERSDLPPAVVDFFRLPYDHMTLRAALKERLLGLSARRPAEGLASLAPEAFERLEELPGRMGETARRLLSRGEPSSSVIDVEVDRSLFASLRETAEASGIAGLTDLALTMADAADAKVLVRASVARMSPPDTVPLLVGEGRLDSRALAKLVGKAPEELAADLVATGLLPGVDPAALADLTTLDPALDALTVAFMRRVRMVASGPEPVLGYLLARQAEALSLRALLVGKLSGLDQDVLRLRLREVAA